jgi:hypothetical protein
MTEIYSRVEPSLLLHIIHTMDDITEQRVDHVPATESLQMASFKLPFGKTFAPHKHISKEQVISYPQESWTVLSGKVKCVLYDINDQVIAEPVLNTGDCSISLYGGHTYVSLEEGTKVREFKVGPYLGQRKDKIMI